MSGIENEQRAVIATIIIRIGLTIFAFTAASPNIKAPTIPIVGPIGEGTLRLASLMNSKDISITRSSNTIGNGIDSLEAAIANNNSVGINY